MIAQNDFVVQAEASWQFLAIWGIFKTQRANQTASLAELPQRTKALCRTGRSPVHLLAQATIQSAARMNLHALGNKAVLLATSA